MIYDTSRVTLRCTNQQEGREWEKHIRRTHRNLEIIHGIYGGYPVQVPLELRTHGDPPKVFKYEYEIIELI